VDFSSAIDHVESWYGDIPKRDKYVRNLVQEPEQNEYRESEFSADVPANALHMAFKMCGRYDSDYPVYDLISDILSRGQGSRFEKSLMKEQQLFSDVSCYVLGAYDAGLLVISGKLKEGVSYSDAESAVWDEIELFKSAGIEEGELQKVKNKYESAKLYSDTNVLNRAMNLCFHELNNDAGDYALELNTYLKINSQQISIIANQVFDKKRCSLLRYKKSE
jgi:predicted Zn-dependent peptidase